jgi:aspartyl-tRNA(Asn)/glutamyl-tRNA(Gln) amidotransferase subunit C
MIDRDTVLHVARLARLELSDEEVAKMSAELSKVLDHIEVIRELDLSDVAGTSHVVDVVNALRADEPRPCLPQSVALAGAPDTVDGGFGVPSPGPAAE